MQITGCCLKHVTDTHKKKNKMLYEDTTLFFIYSPINEFTNKETNGQTCTAKLVGRVNNTSRRHLTKRKSKQVTTERLLL